MNELSTASCWLLRRLSEGHSINLREPLPLPEGVPLPTDADVKALVDLGLAVEVDGTLIAANTKAVNFEYSLARVEQQFPEEMADLAELVKTLKQQNAELRAELESMRRSFVPLRYTPHNHVRDHSKEGTDAADKCAACGLSLYDSIHYRRS